MSHDIGFQQNITDPNTSGHSSPDDNTDQDAALNDDNGLDSKLSDDDSTESTDDEIWPDVSEEILDQDISSNEALPDPIPKRRKVQVVNSILQWLLYFILIWQGVCHLSDNGLAWLLRFLLQFLKVLNIHVTEKLLKKPGFPAKCEEWRTRHTESEQLTDMFDGQLWKDFQKYNGVDFLNAPRNYGLMLNFNFFQPMKHRKDYSVGVLYLVLLNLPRAERFKWENVLVVGIIPVMGKEPKNLNPFLKPLVEELKALWKGVRLQSSLSTISLIFRAALLCTSSDIPASRKLCGFKGHSAELGCSRCLKKFPGGFGEKRDYSGFEEENWQKHKNEEHRRQAKKMSRCKTKKEEAKLSRKYGINYYSELLKLEYFDVVRFCSIHPMHNLFLGTAKYIFKHWVRDGILNKKDLETLESRIDRLEVPVDIGRLPKVISSNYGSYTAEQWKNWTLIYSLYALKDVLPEQDFKCWQSCVLACTYLCKPILSNNNIIKQITGKNIISEQLSRTIRKYGTIEIFNQQFGSKLAYRSKRSTGVLADWPRLDGEIDETCNGMSFGMIEFYFSHLLNFSGEFIKYYFACVTWHKSVDDTNFNSVNPLHVASKDDKLPTGASQFLSVQRISRKCAIANEENEHMDK
ncbi:Hypothetical predicted protein, partial [Paramuricea clavata]